MEKETTKKRKLNMSTVKFLGMAIVIIIINVVGISMTKDNPDTNSKGVIVSSPNNTYINPKLVEWQKQAIRDGLLDSNGRLTTKGKEYSERNRQQLEASENVVVKADNTNANQQLERLKQENEQISKDIERLQNEADDKKFQMEYDITMKRLEVIELTLKLLDEKL